MKKWILSFLAVSTACLVSLGVGWYQSQQLTDLRAYARVLHQENATITESIAQTPPVRDTAAFPLASSGDPSADATKMLQISREMVKNSDPNIDEALAAVDQFSRTPSKTLRALLGQLLEGDFSEEEFKGIEQMALMALTPRDPKSALDHMLRSPYNSNRFGEHVSKAIEKWTAKGHQGVARWLEDAEPSTVKDAAVASFCQEIAEADFDSALTWAESIEDSTLREETLKALEVDH